MSYTFRVPHFSVNQIANSGQVFRMTPDENGGYVLCAGAERLFITAEEDGAVTLSCSQEAFEKRWRAYFDMDTDYAGAMEAIPEEDGFLRIAAASGAGLRILRQDPWEMLITFIISQRKSIPAIRTSVERLCALCGRDMGGWHAFPTAEEIAGCTLDELRSCGVGYRAKYILETARMCVGCDLHALDQLDDAQLLEALTAFPGVGTKVAHCVMLFGYHRFGAAPVDVWIQRVIDQHYGGVNPFPQYGNTAGLYQQYMFYYRQHVLGQ